MNCANQSPLASKKDERNLIAGARLLLSHFVSTLRPSPGRGNAEVAAQAHRKYSARPLFLFPLFPFLGLLLLPAQRAEREPVAAAESKPARTDVYGDPLPPNA